MLENENVKSNYYQSAQPTTKPDIWIVDNQTGECHIIDVACPFDTRVKGKEQER